MFKIVFAVDHIAAQLAADTPLTADERGFLNRLCRWKTAGL